MKRIAQLLGLTALSLAFIGCSPSAEKPADNNDGGGSTGANEKGVIAYSPLTLSNPFFKVIGDNIKAEAEKNGYETLMVDPDMDVKKQSDQMEDFISRGVTAIVLVPCDRLSIGPSVKAANEKGIPVFTVDAKCAAEGVDPLERLDAGERFSDAAHPQQGGFGCRVGRGHWSVTSTRDPHRQRLCRKS